jgi:type IV pilus assembly protein PilB
MARHPAATLPGVKRVRQRLGERLLMEGVITEPQLAEALRAQQVTGEQLGQALVRLGHVAADELLRVLCEEAGIPYLDLETARPDPQAVAAVPAALARGYQALPLGWEEGRLAVALANPFDMAAVAALERASGRPVAVIGAPASRITALLERLGDGGEASLMVEGEEDHSGRSRGPAAPGVPAALLVAEKEGEDAATAAELAEELLQRGLALGATDVHIEPTDGPLRVRYRLDGLLHEGPTVRKATQAALLTRIKILAGLNIAESRLPQDGRIRFRSGGRDIDVRVSTFPTMYGEDIVLRLLDRGRVELKLERLGIDVADVALFREALTRPHGLIPVTGPTGSGKTTTLYAALAELNTTERCVLTLEDPIEYEMAGIRQSQINVRAGLTFAAGLRSLLRHDPDVILVGETRDAETLQIALSAALTGHLVLTTLHTNTAAGAIPRLLDMGAEPFILASSLTLLVAQRLVRVLCQECRGAAEVPLAVRRRFALEGLTLYRAVGCTVCRRTGYRGRIGIFELIPATPAVVACIYERRSAEDIMRAAERPSLLEDGLRKVRAGTTSLDELFRVIAV